MKRRRYILPITIGLIVLLAIIYNLFIRTNYYLLNGGEIEFEPVARTELSASEYRYLTANQRDVYICSLDGLEKRTANGSVDWVKTYQMTSPVMKKAGDYLAVGDILGKTIYVFNQQGLIGKIDESWPILFFSLNRQGEVVSVLEQGEQHKIYIHNREGQALIERGTVFGTDGYPFAVGLSDNGLNLATAYIDVSKDRLQSRLTLFSFDEVNDRKEEFIIGGAKYENCWLADLHYFADRYLWCVGDNQLVIYPMSQKKEVYDSPKTIASPGEIKQVEYTDSEVILLIDSQVVGGERYQLQVYDQAGELLTTHPLAEEPKLLKADADFYYLMTASDIYQYKRGKLNWHTDTYREVIDFYRLDRRHYLLVSPRGYDVLKIRERY